MLVRFATSLLALAVLSQACNKAQRYGDERMGGEPGTTGGVGSETATPPPSDMARAPDAAAGGDHLATDIAVGDSIFHGKAAGGTCQSCHGPDAKGTSLAPDLTDSQWLNTDGTLDGITSTIKSGVAKPKKFTGVMPPMGGAKLTDDQAHEVAQYVYSLSHK